MPTAAINGVTLYWEMTGEAGHPLVLVHGSWGDHHSWDRVVPILAREFRVITYDRRGHSQSQRLGGQGSVRDDVLDLAALVEHLSLAPAHVIGNSFGSSICLRLARERSELFRSLIVHEPPLFALLREPRAQIPLQGFQERLAVVIMHLENGQFESGARHFVDTIAFGPGAWANLPDGIRETFISNAPTFLDEQRDPEALDLNVQGLARFSRPALLTQGDLSESFFPLVVDELAKAFRAPQRHTIRGAGHVPQLTHPDDYTAVVTSFLREVD